MAYKVFSNGNALNASELNTYLMNQSVISFASTTARDAALTAPVEGQLVWLEDSNKYVYYTGSAWADLITPAASSGNAIINGAFDIWQRGTSFSGSTQFFYTADRWESGADTTFTVSRQTFTPGTAPVAGYEFPYFFRFAKNSGGTFMIFRQRIEDVRSFAGQTITVSFYAKADAAGSLSIDLSQNFGSGGSSTVVTSLTAKSLTTSWARYTATVAVPSISGKTVGTSSYLELQFSRLTSGAWTPDISAVQLESGSTATAFKRNASNIQGELAACQRYYVRFTSTSNNYGFFGSGVANSSTNAYINCPLPVEMRTAPISIEYATPSTYRFQNSGNVTVSALALGTIGDGNKTGAISASASSGLTTNGFYHLLANFNTTSYIGFNAEL